MTQTSTRAAYAHLDDAQRMDIALAFVRAEFLARKWRTWQEQRELFTGHPTIVLDTELAPTSEERDQAFDAAAFVAERLRPDLATTPTHSDGDLPILEDRLARLKPLVIALDDADPNDPEPMLRAAWDQIDYEVALTRAPSLMSAPLHMPCHPCGGFDGYTAPLRAVTRDAGVTRGPDPTQRYTLTCGHIVI